MDQFDQLIKEKAEKKVFKYKPLFWFLFAKSAGISAFSAIQIVSGVVIITGVVGGTTYFGIKSLQKEQNPKPETILIDTVISQPKPTVTPDTIQLTPEGLIPSQPNNKVVHVTPSKTQTQKIIEQPKPDPKPNIDSINKLKRERDPFYGRRILTIDPDTILTND
ncbi:MAG TPA: hypothetical protein PLI77_03805 [Bacteroidales bacterium]|nr:hypothetical protein [Bacteroidales bacterium]